MDVVVADVGCTPRAHHHHVDLGLLQPVSLGVAASGARRRARRAAAVDEGRCLRPAEGAATQGGEGAGHIDDGEKQERGSAQERGGGWYCLWDPVEGAGGGLHL
jgi:hypothetical protein